ncbi:MAG: RNA methyltransferase [Candidatus Sericytochromatia bacterium]|nr:RNA methyltransferase [Candidatus Sericytochromatia bacterium]
MEELISQINQIVADRTDYLTVVVEDLYQAHNANSVIRSCESLGILNLHTIENKNKFNLDHNLSTGSDSYLNINRYDQGNVNNSEICINKLKSQGYKIVATTPHKNDYDLNDLPLNNKIAVIFGTEEKGLSDYVINNADLYMKIPMFGFTESLNISVSVAVTVYQLIKKLNSSNIKWKLSENEQKILFKKYLSIARTDSKL